MDPKCPLFSTSPCTLGHLLSSCKEALDRFEWRHNNIVHYLYSTLSSQRLDGVEVYADLEGLRVDDVTIPPDLAVTAQKPDLVIAKRKSKEVKLVELTVPLGFIQQHGSSSPEEDGQVPGPLHGDHGQWLQVRQHPLGGRHERND